MPVKNHHNNTYICIDCKQAYSNEQAAETCEMSHYCSHNSEKYAWFDSSDDLFEFCSTCKCRLLTFNLKDPKFPKIYLNEFSEIRDDESGITNWGRQLIYTRKMSEIINFLQKLEIKKELKLKVEKL